GRSGTAATRQPALGDAQRADHPAHRDLGCALSPEVGRDPARELPAVRGKSAVAQRGRQGKVVLTMKSSASRILTTHVGSMPRPESIKAMLRARLTCQAVDEAQLSASVEEAGAEADRQPAPGGSDAVAEAE